MAIDPATGRFLKGESPNPGGKPKASVVSSEPVDVLKEMEGLLTRPEGQDVLEFQKKLRGIYKDDFKEYMRQLTVWRGKRKAEEVVVEDMELDEGTDATRVVLERVIGELLKEAQG